MQETHSSEENDLRRMDDFRRLEEMRIQSTHSYDKVLLTLSAGALAATLGVVPSFIEGTVVWKWMLVVASGALTLTILCMGFGFFASKEAARMGIKKMQAGAELKDARNTWSQVIPVLNGFGGILFAVGLVLMVIFALGNFRHAEPRCANGGSLSQVLSAQIGVMDIDVIEASASVR